MHLTEQPTEILIHILSHLTWFDIVTCSYVNKQWHSLACAEYLYKDLYFTSFRNMDACLTVFEETALKRNCPSRQSEYSYNNYSHFVRGIHLAQTIDFVDYNKLLDLLKHCPFVQDMKIGHHGLNDEHLACIRQTCLNLRRMDTSGCGLVTWKGLLDQQRCDQRIALESLTTGLCFEFWSTPPLSIAPGVQFPYLREIKTHVTNITQFQHARQLLLMCQETLESVGIYWFYQPSIGAESTLMSNTLQAIPNLKKLSLIGCSGHVVEQFGPHLTELELRGRCTDVTIDAFSKVKNLRRLSLSYTGIPARNVQSVLIACGERLESLYYNESSQSALDKETLQHCTGLKYIHTSLRESTSFLDIISQLYSTGLEHIVDTSQLANSLADSGIPEECVWPRLLSTTWKSVKSIHIIRAAITIDQLLYFPVAFPNVEYISLVLKVTEGTMLEKVKLFLRHAHQLKGLQLGAEIGKKGLGEGLNIARQLQQLFVTYRDWKEHRNKECYIY
jgi:F-box-like